MHEVSDVDLTTIMQRDNIAAITYDPLSHSSRMFTVVYRDGRTGHGSTVGQARSRACRVESVQKLADVAWRAE